MILASACSPVGQIANPACARVRARNCWIVSAIGRRLRPRCSSRSTVKRLRHFGEFVRRAGPVILRNGCSEPTVSRKVSSAASDSAKIGPCRVANTASSSSGRSIAISALRSVSHLLALVEGAATEQDVGHPPRLQRAHVAARDVVAPGVEAAEQDAYVARLDRDRAVPAARAAVTVHPLSRISHEMKPATALGSDSSIFHLTIRP